MGVEAMLVADVSGKHLVDTARWLVDQPLLGVQDFNTLGERGTHTDHIGSNIENDGGLLAVGGTTIYLGAFFTIAAG